MENQNMENQSMVQDEQHLGANESSTQQAQAPERTFTQEEVNRIIRERLARAKSTADNSNYTEREQALEQRERHLEAREKLADAGLPKELLPLVNCSGKKEMEESIKLIGNYFRSDNSTGNIYRISTGTASDVSKTTDCDIRAAMGLKGR